MQLRKCCRWLPWLACLGGAVGFMATARAEVTHFGDILHWTGSGPNEAALVLDWSDTADAGNPLVWGYRWEGSATGAQLFFDIVREDDRLFTKVNSTTALNRAVYGIGYDLNPQTPFELDLGTTFDATGVVATGPPDLGGNREESVDLLDLYQEGWYTGFWHLGTSQGSPYAPGAEEQWQSPGSGLSGISLSDGLWLGLTYTPTFDFGAFPDLPTAAAPDVWPGDFNRDGVVDAADYTVWRDTLDTIVVAGSGADANQDGRVDSRDYQVWRQHFGESAGASLSVAATTVVPEPATAMLLTLLLALLVAVLGGVTIVQRFGGGF